MSHSPFKRNLYILLGNLKREGKQKIEVRELMRLLKVERTDPDSVIFVVRKVIELGYEVKVNGREEE
jgi:hypothetical protein